MKTSVKSRLSDLLKSSGKSVSELAKESNVDYPTVYRISTGETVNPSRKTLLPIAKSLSVNVEWLQKGIGEKEAVQQVEENAWKVAVESFRESNEHLKEEVKYYRQLLMQITGGKGFLQLIRGKAALNNLQPTGSDF